MPHVAFWQQPLRAIVASTQQTTLRTEDLDYVLPQELIATRPAEPRDSARMLVMWRSREGIEHRHIRDLPDYLSQGDALVFNTTAVVPARLIMRRKPTGGRVEGLFLEEAQQSGEWKLMLHSGGRLRVGDELELLDRADHPSGITIQIIAHDEETWLVHRTGSLSTMEALERVGRTPLPPYIVKARQTAIADDADRAWYQTVYAELENRKSVAAPTAGLHFTPELLNAIERKGVGKIDVTLHVGPGTFKPVTAPTLAEHRMHTEWFDVPRASLLMLHETKARGGNVIAVGTTSVRAMESLPHHQLGHFDEQNSPQFCGGVRGMTDLLIAPPFEFKHVNGMLTNFHLPRSTLLALVAAMVGLDRLKAVYREAIDRRYRFYSYGDAMLILP
jgi:S-adenosylmethionine:tRNA ribosyltransferase-isomerase